MRRARAIAITHGAGDHPEQGSTIDRGEQGHLVRFETLVGGREHFVAGRQVDPELDAVEQATRNHQRLGRGLNVEDPRPGRHPLRRSVGNQAPATVGVLVGEGAVDHVRHRLKTTVGMPRGAFRLPGGIVDRPHLVHVDKGIESVQG